MPTTTSRQRQEEGAAWTTRERASLQRAHVPRHDGGGRGGRASRSRCGGLPAGDVASASARVASSGREAEDDDELI